MAHTKCPKCSTEVADKVMICPQCTHPITDPNVRSVKRKIQKCEKLAIIWFSLFILGIIFIFIFTGVHCEYERGALVAAGVSLFGMITFGLTMIVRAYYKSKLP